jgi:hypothetical protein
VYEYAYTFFYLFRDIHTYTNTYIHKHIPTYIHTCRLPGADDESFTHMWGSVSDESGIVHTELRIRLRKAAACAPEVQTVFECEAESKEAVGCGRRCNVALDDKNYRSDRWFA